MYEQVRKNVDNSVFDRIAAAADKYSPDSLKVEKLLSILYLTTIAEENKEHAQVGKRIKRLGIHMLLKENIPANEAADYTRGMKGWAIEKLCEERGF